MNLKRDGKKRVEVIFGKHINIVNGKEQLDKKLYFWINGQQCKGRLKEGSIVIAQTKEATGLVLVEGVVKMPYHFVRENKIAFKYICKLIV